MVFYVFLVRFGFALGSLDGKRCIKAFKPGIKTISVIRKIFLQQTYS